MSFTGFSTRSEQSSVRDQGDRPTCAVFAITGAHEAARADDVALSPESCLWAANNVGGTSQPAISVVVGLVGLDRIGQAPETEWPYGNPAHPASPPAGSTAGWFTRWHALVQPGVVDIDHAIQAGSRVILTATFVPDAWLYASADGFLHSPPNSIVRGSHAIVATGVGTWSDGSTVVEFKNSWDADWGDNGYGYMTEEYWTEYGRKAFAL
jgi:Papain family cysteine protease